MSSSNLRIGLRLKRSTRIHGMAKLGHEKNLLCVSSLSLVLTWSEGFLPDRPPLPTGNDVTTVEKNAEVH